MTNWQTWFRPTLSGFVLTRDSWWWFTGKLAGIAGLVVSGAIDPKALGLSDKQAHVVMGVSAAILAISSQLSTSNLPGKAAADQVKTTVKESL